MSAVSPYLPIAARSTNGLEALKADINRAASMPQLPISHLS